LTGLLQEQLRSEYIDVTKQISYFEGILSNDELCRKVIKDELADIKARYGDERRSIIMHSSEDFNPEDFYSDEEMVITISHMGYIKRTPLSEFRSQNRGGIGAKGTDTRNEDYIERIYPATMHNTMMFFTRKGKCFWLKVYEIPEGMKNSKGRAIQNLLNIDPEDTVETILRVDKFSDKDYVKTHNVVFCTKQGFIKKTSLEDFSHLRQNGINAIKFRKGDSLVEVRLSSGNDDIIMASRNGQAIRFSETRVRTMGRNARGVCGMRFSEKDDEIIGLICIGNPETESIMVVSEQGYGKRSEVETYRMTNRGGKGVKAMKITEKTGKLIAIKSVTPENNLMIINKSGITIRMKINDIRVMGRTTQGVRLINLEKRRDQIGSVCEVSSESGEEETIDEN
jgi:DNA gyrase subunit A